MDGVERSIYSGEFGFGNLLFEHTPDFSNYLNGGDPVIVKDLYKLVKKFLIEESNVQGHEHVHEQTPLRITLVSTMMGTKLVLELTDGLKSLFFWLRNNFTVNTNYVNVPVQEWQVSLFDRARVLLEILEGGCATKEVTTRKIIVRQHKLLVENPPSNNNNCGIECLRLLKVFPQTNKELRVQVGIAAKVKIPSTTLLRIADIVGVEVEILTHQSTDESILDGVSNLFLTKTGHYTVVRSVDSEKHKNAGKKTCGNGLLFYDLETRPYKVTGHTKSGVPIMSQKETIIAITYKLPRAQQYSKMIFVSDTRMFAGEKLLKWLLTQPPMNCYAHNGSRFDVYFLLSYVFEKRNLFKESKKDDSPMVLNMVLRGLSVISFDYEGHTFLDTCCYLTSSLKQLCKEFKPKHNKIDDTDLCFYKPELCFWDFMALKHEEPEFWKRYSKYCLYDVLSLSEIFTMFNTESIAVIREMSEECGFDKDYLASKGCTVVGTLTVGSLSKKLFKNTADTALMKEVEAFLDGCPKKFKYLQKYVRGGVSIVQQPGRHNYDICLYDIKSMYPAAMVYMRVPVGKSTFIDVPEETASAFAMKKPGYYHVKRLEFSDVKLRPISNYGKEDLPRKEDAGDTLVWKKKVYEELYVDFEMLEYVCTKYKVVHLEFVDCLVSDQSRSAKKLFTNFVDVLYAKKQAEDDLPKELRNNGKRNFHKLSLNSLSGKMVENPSEHTDYVLAERADEDTVFLNGHAVKKKPRDKINNLFTLGLSIYSYSKRLLWEYIRLLPDKEDDIIASETDSIYVKASHQNDFESRVNAYSNPRYPVNMGSKLGEFDLEGSSSEYSLFLGKKVYCFGKDKFRFKGARSTYINAEGKIEVAIKKEKFDELYEQGTVVFEQSNLKRKFHSKRESEHIGMNGYNDVKRFKASYYYAEYN